MEPRKTEFRGTKGFDVGPADFNVTSKKPQHARRKSTKYHSFLSVVLSLAVIAIASQFAAAQAPPTFQHPGVLVGRAQLDFIKAQVNSHIDPIYSEFVNAQASRYGSTSPYTPQGPPSNGIIDCGPISNPDNGCSAEDEDGTTAYTQALLYWITGNSAYARNAITILNTYGHKLTSYTNSNGPLQAAWGSSKWARAAEIIRYSNAGWSAADAQTFGTMMTNAMLPNLINGRGGNGNWELSMIEGMIGIAVYNNDASLFNHAVTFWRQRVPAYFYYFPIDGPNPVPPPRGSLNWNGQTVFNASVNGVAQETCRDFGHTEYSIAATMNAAETARIQGVDLYGSEKPRLEAALEFHAFYLLGNPVPSSVCGGHVTLLSYPTFEIAYNNYHNRLGDSLSNTLQWLVKSIRTKSVEVDHHMMVFETLTYGTDAVNSTPVCVTTTANGPWQNTVFANQTGTFTATYDATPSASGINAVIGLSNGVQSAYTGFAVITRFNPSGAIDARSGGAYTASSTIPYSGGVKYHFRVAVNVTTHTYAAYVTAQGGTEQTIGTNLAFRTEQNTVTQLNWVGAFSEAGSESVCSFAQNGGG